MAATTLGLSSGSRAHSPSPPARTDLRLRATRSWLKQRGALREDPNQRGDACAGLGTPRGLRRQTPEDEKKEAGSTLASLLARVRCAPALPRACAARSRTRALACVRTWHACACRQYYLPG